MEIKILASAGSVAREGAAIIAAAARAAVATRGRFVLAVSGGQTPWLMLRDLAGEDVSWDGVHVAQADERVAPAGIRTETSPICARACSSTLRCAHAPSLAVIWRQSRTARRGLVSIMMSSFRVGKAYTRTTERQRAE
jgi:hypothetical protein